MGFSTKLPVSHVCESAFSYGASFVCDTCSGPTELLLYFALLVHMPRWSNYPIARAPTTPSAKCSRNMIPRDALIQSSLGSRTPNVLRAHAGNIIVTVGLIMPCAHGPKLLSRKRDRTLQMTSADCGVRRPMIWFPELAGLGWGASATSNRTMPSWRPDCTRGYYLGIVYIQCMRYAAA